MDFRSLRRFGFAGGLLLGLGMIVMFGAVEVSSTPRFCGSCHVMNPYFESWRGSSHNGIACVECHISPGIAAEVRKKYEALAMVARYFTGTYGTNPWAEVDDAACLRCHERRILVGKVLFEDVLFDHGPHLTELRRGKQLRCTSCHSQIVQGSHIAVTATTCFICHFKGEVSGAGTARCTLCHRVPEKVVDAEGLEFDHSDVVKFGMECESCHTPAGPEEGAVPKERCLTCHNEPERLEEYDNSDALHRYHVSDHKVECTNCHLEIAHVAPKHFDAARTECGTCHSGGHSPQRDLYAGLGAKGVEPMPDVMYRAGVRCEGCHLHADGETRVAGEVSCMKCHGPSYRKIYLSWSRSVGDRVRGLRRQIDQSAVNSQVSSSPSFELARANLSLVERARGIHNVRYSLAILGAAHEQLNVARSEADLALLPTPWVSTGDSGCFECHVGAEGATVQIFGRSFPHRPHVIGRKLDCESCHTTHEERASPGVGALHFGSDGCAGCHHGQGGNCSDCHGTMSGPTFETELGTFSHVPHVEDSGLACADCHGDLPSPSREANREMCEGCHG